MNRESLYEALLHSRRKAALKRNLNRRDKISIGLSCEAQDAFLRAMTFCPLPNRRVTE